MNGDVKFFNGTLYHELNGQWYPLRIGGSGGGGLSRAAVLNLIQNNTTQTQLAVEVIYNSGTNVLTATVTGGTPSAYDWTIASFNDNPINGTAQETLSYSNANGNATRAIVPPIAGCKIGLARVKVTDTLGRIAYGYFWLWLAPAA